MCLADFYSRLGTLRWILLLKLPALRVVYVGGPSHTFGKRLGALIRDKYGVEVKVVFSTFKVGSYFGLKSQIPPLFKSNIVYKFVCP